MSNGNPPRSCPELVLSSSKGEVEGVGMTLMEWGPRRWTSEMQLQLQSPANSNGEPTLSCHCRRLAVTTAATDSKVALRRL